METVEVIIRTVEDPDLARRSKLVDLLAAAFSRCSADADAGAVDFGPASAVYDDVDDQYEASRW